MAQFSWFLWVPLPHEFKSAPKTDLERGIFSETKTRRIHEIAISVNKQEKKNQQSTKFDPDEIK